MIQTFDFNELPVRVLMRDAETWFVAADVCRVLEIANSRDAVGSLDDDEKGVASRSDSNVGNADSSLPNRGMQIISESGLYALIFKSRKAEAKRFRKWVTAEVLPAIRRTGAYGLPAVGEVGRVSVLDFVAGLGWPLRARLEFGLTARRYARAMGVQAEMEPHPVGGLVLTLPVGVLEQVRGEFTRGRALPGTELPEVVTLLDAVLPLADAKGWVATETLLTEALRLGLLRRALAAGQDRPAKRMLLGRVLARFCARPLPEGLWLEVCPTRSARGFRVTRAAVALSN